MSIIAAVDAPARRKRSEVCAYTLDGRWLELQLSRVGQSPKGLSQQLKPGSPNGISELVRGERHLRLNDAVSLANALKCSIDDLISAYRPMM